MEFSDPQPSKKARLEPSVPLSADTNGPSNGHSEGLDPAAERISSPVPGTSINCQKDDDDNLSIISGLSDMSGKGWKPDMTGKLGWLVRAKARGADPRDIVSNVFQEAGMLNCMDDDTIWAVLFKMFAEPPRREKLKEFNTLEDIVQHIKHAKNILVLTGAGVSVSCGIPDFRSKDGVYARLAVDFPDLPDPQAMFDIGYFRKDPRPFFKFAKEIYPGQFSPSPCHRFINCLEREGKLLRNYTQNIDTLEQVAGITKVVQCHGSFATASCTKCKLKLSAESVRTDIMEQKIPLCPSCPSPELKEILESLSTVQTPSLQTGSNPVLASGEANVESANAAEMSSNPEAVEPPASSAGKQVDPQEPVASPAGGEARLASLLDKSPFSAVPIMKPDIVFFGEGLSDEFHKAISEDKNHVDLLIVIGSSLKVRPVALIPSSIPEHVPQILINRERLSHLTFDVELLGDCDTIINQLCHMLEGDWSHPIHAPPLVQTQHRPELNGSLDESKSDENPDDSVEKPGAEPKSEPSSETEPNGESTAGTEGSDKIDGKSEQKDDISTSKNESDGTKDDSLDSEDNKSLKKNDEGLDEDDRNDESEDWKPKPISELIPEGHFLFVPPHRYVFSGAEVYADDLSDNDLDEEDEDEEDELEEEEEDNEEPETSSDQVDPVSECLEQETGDENKNKNENGLK